MTIECNHTNALFISVECAKCDDAHCYCGECAECIEDFCEASDESHA